MSDKRTATSTAPNASPKRRTAFITAPLSTDLTLLQQVLHERGVDSFRLDQMAVGQTIADLVRRAIQHADFVIAVVPEGPARENVLFELGLATALNKRVLALVSGRGAIPLAVSGMAYLRTDASNREAIEFGLDQLLAAPAVEPDVPLEGGQKTHPIGDKADSLIRDLERLREDGHFAESRFIEIVCKAIMESGVSALAHESRMGKNAVVDIAVWADDLEPWIGNPLIIECKKSIGGASDYERSLERLDALLCETRASTSMLVYLDADPKVLRTNPGNPRTMVLSADELIGGLRNRGFGELLRHTRNEIVHGRG